MPTTYVYHTYSHSLNIMCYKKNDAIFVYGVG